MKSKKILTVISTVLLSSIILTMYFHNQESSKNNSVAVLKCRKNLEIGENIKKDDVYEVKINKYDIDKNYVKNNNELKDYIVEKEILKDEYINKKRLIKKGDNKKLYISKDDKRQFSIPSKFIDDKFSLTLRKGDIVDIILTQGTNDIPKSEVKYPKAKVLGALDSKGKFIEDIGQSEAAEEIIFETITKDLLEITKGQYQGKFKFVKVPNNGFK